MRVTGIVRLARMRTKWLLIALPLGILAVLFGIWCLSVYQRQDGAATLVAAIVAFVVSFGLVVYDRWFLRKTRTLR